MTGRVYRIELARAVRRALLKLPVDVTGRIEAAIDELASDPRPHGVKKLAGQQNLYRLRVGDYRVLYKIHERVLLILVVAARHRREVYRR